MDKIAAKNKTKSREEYEMHTRQANERAALIEQASKTPQKNKMQRKGEMQVQTRQANERAAQIDQVKMEKKLAMQRRLEMQVQTRQANEPAAQIDKVKMEKKLAYAKLLQAKKIAALARMKPIDQPQPQPVDKPKTLTQGGISKDPVKFDKLRYYQERKLAEQQQKNPTNKFSKCS